MLKKSGKGLITELIYLLVFCICLVVSVVLTNQLGLIKDLNDALNPVDDNTKEKIENKINKITIKSTKNYSQMEYEIKDVSKKYVKDNYSEIPSTLIIRISTLIENEYLDNVYDAYENKCTGYTTCTKGLFFYKYKTYLKCGDSYQTKNYDAKKDW